MNNEELRLAKARALLKKYKLDGWEVNVADLSQVKSKSLLGGWTSGALGVCHFASKKILIDQGLVKHPTFFRQTILHEIAHALLGRRGHGPDWLAIARRVGCTPKSLEPYQFRRM